MPARKELMKVVDSILNKPNTTWQEKKEELVDLYIKMVKLE